MKIDPISLRVNQLEMTDFRGFKRCTIKFSKNIQTTVFVGANGAGKTSILDSVAILLSWLIARLKPKDNPKIENRGLLPSNDDVRIGDQDYLSCHISVGDLSFDYWINHYMIDGDVPDFPQELFNLSRSLRLKIFNHAEKVSIPLVVYYRTNRIVNEIPLEFQTGVSYNQFNAYDDALEGIIDFHAFFKWYRHQEDIENQEYKKDSSYKDRFLMAVRNAVTQFSSLEGYTNLAINRSSKPESMVVTKEIEGSTQELKLNQLSDGEKCLLALIGDLARRLAIANPNLSDPLKGSGVILIDEIDLHLHPKWQRTIIPDLEKTFPNIQFIVTTHSPQVLSQVRQESIYILKQTPEGIIAERPTDGVYGRDSNHILEAILGGTERPTEQDEKIDELFRLIEEGQLEKAKKLKEELEDLTDNDPVLYKADLLIKRRESLGK